MVSAVSGTPAAEFIGLRKFGMLSELRLDYHGAHFVNRWKTAGTMIALRAHAIPPQEGCLIPTLLGLSAVAAVRLCWLACSRS
jgi:hypothetical protein